MEGAKLTATSDGGFALASGGNRIGYALAGSSEGEEKTEWVFETLDQTQATTQDNHR